MPSLIALQRRFVASLLPCPSARRWRCRRHQTCVCTDAPDGARPRGERKDALDTGVEHSSTSSFCRRRRRRRLLGRQAAGRGTTFGAGFAARRAASAPSPPHHLQSTRAHSAPSVGRCTGTSRPDLGVRAQLHRSARASRRAAKGPREVDVASPSVAIVGSCVLGRSCPSSSGAEARGARRGLEKKVGGGGARIKGGPSQYA